MSVIPYSVRGKKELVHLDLSNTSIRELPNWLPELIKLKSIRLNGTLNLHPVKAAKVLSQLKSLEKIEWSDARLLYFPIPLTRCQALKSIDVSNNAISELPKNIHQIQLQQLNISNNLIDSLPNNMALIGSLERLDFSYNPGMVNSYNYQLISVLPKLKYIALNGAFFIPEQIGLLKHLKSLELEFCNIANIPKKTEQLKDLESISFYASPNIKLAEAFEILESCPKIKTLTIGHPKLNQVPYNIIKLKKLKTLHVKSSCFDRFPGSFSKLKIKQLSIVDSKINDPTAFFKLIEEIVSIKVLELIHIQFGSTDWEAFLGTLDTLNIENCGLSKRHFNAQKINYLKARGNHITDDALRKLNAQNHNISEVWRRHLYTKKTTKEKFLVDDSAQFVFKKKIYASVGEIVDLPNGIRLNIPGNAFLDKNGKVILEEVDLHCSLMMHPSQYLETGFPLWDRNRNGLHFLKALKIEAYYLNEKAYINQKQPIQFTYDVFIPNDWTGYKYDFFQKRWEEITTHIEKCNIQLEATPSDEFKAIVLGSNLVNTRPKMEVKRAGVYFKLKHNRRRKTLNFDLEPDYNYLPSYLPGINQNVFAFPDLKVYKNIRWNYMGDSLIGDLTDLVLLDPEARPEKIGRKSTFSFTSFDVADMFVAPHSEKDYYVLSICKAQDTLRIPVLPSLPFTKPKKIQKWHKRRYVKYQKLKFRRYEKWSDLDSSYLKSVQKNQNRIEQQGSYLRDSIFQNTKIESPSNLVRYSFNISSPGWYGLARNLNFENTESITPEFKIGTFKNYSKVCLVYDIDRGIYYWSNTNNMQVEKNSKVFVYVRVGSQYNYAGPLNKQSAVVELEKMLLDEN